MEDQVFKPSTLISSAATEIELKLALSQLCNIAAEISQVDVFAWLLRLEELEADLALWILISQLWCEYRDQIPTKTPPDAASDLTLVHGLEVIGAHELVNQEEVEAILGGKLSAQSKISLLIVHTLLLVGHDLYCAALSNGSLVALKMLFKRLIDGGDNLVDCELHSAN